ncbi:MAG: SMP-30/gluconolactonase/LRE family protein [Hyphomicrobiales bacterium]
MECIATGYGLIEGPVWDARAGLYFSDAVGGGVYLLDRSGKISTAVPKRRGVGGMALHSEDSLVMGGRDIAVVRLADGKTSPILTLSQLPGATGFNDLTADAAGRVYVGSLTFRVFSGDTPTPGYLHRIDLDGTIHTVADGIMLSNGIAFSGDGRLLYHADARADVVRVYDVQPDGSLGKWRPFATFGGHGTPDGMKVAADGSVWVAVAHAGIVRGFNADGSHRRDIVIPLPLVTSICFGGDDLRDLYVVTGSKGGPSDRCGSIYRMRSDVAGVPMHAAKVRV